MQTTTAPPHNGARGSFRVSFRRGDTSERTHPQLVIRVSTLDPHLVRADLFAALTPQLTEHVGGDVEWALDEYGVILHAGDITALPNPSPFTDWWSMVQVAEYLGVKRSTLDGYRHQRTPWQHDNPFPDPDDLGDTSVAPRRRSIRYRPMTVITWDMARQGKGWRAIRTA